MSELMKKDVYACALPMPSPEAPVCSEWVAEIARQRREIHADDEIYLIGHSLGVPAILRFLENDISPISGAILVSGPCEKTDNEKLHSFFEHDFDFETIRANCQKFGVIHGDNDTVVPLKHAKVLSEKCRCKLVVISGGEHLNGSAGFFTLPECLTMLMEMMEEGTK